MPNTWSLTDFKKVDLFHLLFLSCLNFHGFIQGSYSPGSPTWLSLYLVFLCFQSFLCVLHVKFSLCVKCFFFSHFLSGFCCHSHHASLQLSLPAGRVAAFDRTQPTGGNRPSLPSMCRLHFVNTLNCLAQLLFFFIGQQIHFKINIEHHKPERGQLLNCKCITANWMSESKPSLFNLRKEFF